MNINLFWLVTFFLFGIQILIGLLSRKKNNSIQSYFLSDRNVGFLFLTFTFVATQVGGGAIIGSAEASYKYGIMAILYSSGLALGFIVISMGLGEKLRNMNISTIPEIFEHRYNSKILRQVSSLLLIITNFLIMGSLCISFKKLFVAIGIENEIVFVTLWTSIVIYTALGGLNAVINTDMLQISFIMIVFGFIFYKLLLYTEINYIMLFDTKNHSLQENWSSWILSPMLIIIIGQDMGQRCFAAKNSSVVSLSAISSSILMIAITLVPVIIGIVASKNYHYDNISLDKLINLVVEICDSQYIGSLFACAVLMAIVSTVDSLLCAISSNIIIDLNVNHKSSKIVSALVGTSSLCMCYFISEIMPLMLFAYKISVCSLSLPVLLGACKNKNSSTKSIAPYLSICFGIIICVIFEVNKIPNAEIFSISFASLLYVSEFIYNKKMRT